jgi:glyoxylase-like metal-dependent hydrolase (beta-lactamase superfamily II)
MRVSAVTSDVLVFVSDFWQTTCTAVRAGEEGFVIDSPVYPVELQALPGVLEQAGFAVSGLLATHGDWDHLLGRLAFPAASLGCGDSTAQRLAQEPGAAQRKLRDFDAEHYVPRSAPLALGNVQALPLPGKLELGSAHELEIFPADGHTVDGAAFWLPWLRVLVCGDYLSPVEIPMLNPGGSVNAYQATLERLRPLVEQADWVIPGHGTPQSGEAALALLSEDAAYMGKLADDPEQAVPPDSRADPVQRRIHAANLEALASSE